MVMKINEQKVNELIAFLDKAIVEFQERRKGLYKTDVVEDETELKTVKRHAEVGERILIVDASREQLRKSYTNGFVMTVTEKHMRLGDVECEDYGYIDNHEYEVIIEEPETVEQDVPPYAHASSIKSPNQQRAQTIQRARDFFDENADGDFHCEVDKEKRTVFVYKVVSNNFGSYSAITGLAVCRENEVFNEFIGMAIALARALEIDIPQEFINAVKPDKVVVGMVVKGKNTGRIYNISKVHSDGLLIAKEHTGVFGDDFCFANEVTIIDDTKAIYEE